MSCTIIVTLYFLPDYSHSCQCIYMYIYFSVGCNHSYAGQSSQQIMCVHPFTWLLFHNCLWTYTHNTYYMFSYYNVMLCEFSDGDVRKVRVIKVAMGHSSQSWLRITCCGKNETGLKFWTLSIEVLIGGFMQSILLSHSVPQIAIWSRMLKCLKWDNQTYMYIPMVKLRNTYNYGEVSKTKHILKLLNTQYTDLRVL